MKAGRKPTKGFTERETEIMATLWKNGPMYVREIVAEYPEPRPHVNTISTLIRILEEKGHVGHETTGGSYRYFAKTRQEECRSKTLGRVISDFFNNSYKLAVSELVEEEKLSVDDLREIIDMIEEHKAWEN